MSDTQNDIHKFIDSLEQKIRHELKIRCELYKPDFKHPEVFSVLAALLARQATLAIELIGAPQLWNGHSSPLFLPAMTDVHITLSWILLEPVPRAKQYMEHGLGQAVLALEHRKANLDKVSEDSKVKIQEVNKVEEAWINAQKLTFFIDVNVGSWSGKTTRDMAQEAGILDFYNHVYTPFSQCAHSTWHHVGKYNSVPSETPLNRHIWMPMIADSSSDIWELHLAVKYVDKTFNIFDEKAIGREPCSNIQDWIYDEIQILLNEKEASTPTK